MKVLCPQCERLVELRDFRLEGAVLAVTCSACGATSRTGAHERPALSLTSAPGTSNVVALRTPSVEAVALAADAARGEAFAVPEGRCPKCVAPRPSAAVACAQCGLTFAQFDPAEVAPPAWLGTAWAELLAKWDDVALHDALRSRALAEEALPALGRLYRIRLAAMPEDPFAQRGRDEVVRLALIPSAPREVTAASDATATWKYVVFGLVFLVSLTVVTLMARAMLDPAGP